MLRFIFIRAMMNVHPKVFQYISCYGLSPTMDLSGIQTSNFNTSHVTVYLLRSYNRKLSIMISIHLMLRFISLKEWAEENGLSFQYISCYGLSVSSRARIHMIQISIHLMLRFIK